MLNRAIAMLCLLTLASPASAQGCVDITDRVAFCPEGTLWDGLIWQRIPDPPATLWETADLALIVGEIPVQFASGPVEVGQKALAEVIDDFVAMPEGAEVIDRFAPLGDSVPATARVIHDPAKGTVEYVTLYALGEDILMVQTVANAGSLTQDHGLRHEQALRSLVETGA